jgi:predicted transcriptional regulator
MEHLSSNMEHQDKEQQHQVEWRRDKIQELCSKGYSQREISQLLQVGLATVNRDISYLRDQAKTNIKKYIDERLPEEYEKCLVGLNAITKEAWNTRVVDDAIRFVSEKSKENLESSPSSNDEVQKESSEPDYNEDGDQLEAKTGEMTINQVF